MVDKISTAMRPTAPTSAISIIVPTHDRPDGLRRLAESVHEHAPTLPIHSVRTPTDEYDVPAVTMWESDAFPIGKVYRAVAERIGEGAYLFLDDDHTLGPGFSTDHFEQAARRYPAWGLPVRSDLGETTVRDMAKCGGQLVTADLYDQIGGHGDDYLEDIELSYRCSWAGTPPRRYPDKVTTHHTGESGGLRDRDDIQPKRTAHERLSKLDERYERITRSESSYYGFREVSG